MLAATASISPGLPAGDAHESALVALSDATAALVFGLLLRIVGDRAAAEEVAGDVCLQVWRQAARFDRARGTALAWLLTVARSRAIDGLTSFSKSRTAAVGCARHSHGWGRSSARRSSSRTSLASAMGRSLPDWAARADRQGYRFALAGDGDWRAVASGIFRRDLGEAPASGSRSYLIRMEPGARGGPHVHASAEHCLVLEDDLEVAGRRLRPGDFHLAAPGSVHEHNTIVGGCLVLIVEAATPRGVRPRAGRIPCRAGGPARPSVQAVFAQCLRCMSTPQMCSANHRSIVSMRVHASARSKPLTA